MSFLWRSWFWLGIWVFNYLRYTDYVGIGLLETVMITTATLGEIPTGAIADILGKKKAVIIAFGLGVAGNLMQAFAPNYVILMLSVVTMTIGGAFYSGSLEALVYDSLKEAKKSDAYQKVIGRMTTMQNLGMAVAGITGGFLYSINTSLPFIFVAIAYAVGLYLSLGLTEPKIDSEKYSWKKFFLQNKEGFNQLFANKKMSYLALLFLVPGAFMIATENMINDATAIQLGFNSRGLGIFTTILYLFGILASEKSEWIVKKLNSKIIYITLIVLYVITLLLMPIASFAIGALLLLLRYGAATVYSNYESVRINTMIDSKYRATTLSTFSLIRNIPYVIAATYVGLMLTQHGAKLFSLYFGITVVAAIAILYLIKPIFRMRNSS